MMYNPLPASGPFVRGLALGSCALPPGAGHSLLRGDPGRGQEKSLRRPCSALLPAPAHRPPVLPRTSSPAPSSPFSSGPWKKQPQLPAFWQQFYSVSAGHKDLNFCTRVVKVGLEEQQRVIQPSSVHGSTATRSPTAHPSAAGERRCPRLGPLWEG